MARTKGKGPNLSWGPVIEAIGKKELIRQIGPELLMEALLKEIGPEQILDATIAQLTPEQLRELKKRLP